LDVAGNLWEWCLNDYEQHTVFDGYGNGQSKVLRGCAFIGAHGSAAASVRGSLDPFSVNDVIGFRLVLSALLRL